MSRRIWLIAAMWIMWFIRRFPARREWEVMQLLGQGLSTDDVAGKLFVAPTTVRVHVATVLKLRVEDRDSAFKLLQGE